MALWYVSSTAYAAVAAWAATTAYTVGQFVRAVSPASGALHVFRCTTAGTTAAAEPTWVLTTIGTSTTASGTAVFTLVSGVETYGWSAAAGSLNALNGNSSTTPWAAGDVIYASSDHVDLSTTFIQGVTSLANGLSYISVNKAGSVPPVAADYLAGAMLAPASGTLTIGGSTSQGPMNWFGFTFKGPSNILFSATTMPFYFKDCLFWLNSGTATTLSSASVNKVTWDNCKVKFSASTQLIGPGSAVLSLEWVNSPAAIDVTGTIPAVLFKPSTNGVLDLAFTGVDFSALGAGQAVIDTSATVSTTNGSRARITNCIKSSSAAWVLGAGNSTATKLDTGGMEVEIFNSDSGNTTYVNERWMVNGNLTTETSVTAVSGPSTFGQTFSHKLTTYALMNNVYSDPFYSFPIWIPLSSVGVSTTFTVDILQDATVGTFLPWMGNGKDFTYSNGNLSVLNTLGSVIQARTAPFITTGKYYFEVTIDTLTGTASIGAAAAWSSLSAALGASAGTFGVANSNAITGTRRGNFGPTLTAATATLYNTGKVVGCAIDFTNGLFWVRVNGGIWNNNAANNPATGVGGFDFSSLLIRTGINPGMCVGVTLSAVNDKVTINSGGTSFGTAAPSGFSALNTAGFGLTNADVALDLSYLPDVSDTLGIISEGMPALPGLTTPVALTSSARSWNGSLPNAVPFKLQAVLTPQRAGFAMARVRVGKPGLRLYVDPVLQAA